MLTIISAIFFMMFSVSGDPETMLQLRESVNFSYSVTNWFLDLIRGPEPPTSVIKSYTNVMTSHDARVSFRSIQPIVLSYLGFGICVALGLLFVIGMPIVGLIFCCARCCGKCGGQVQLMDSRNDRCKRIAYAVSVLVIVTLQLVATVLVFINHFLLHESLVSRDPRIGAISQLDQSLTESTNALDDMHRTAIGASSADLSSRKELFMNVITGKLEQFQVELIKASDADSVSQSIQTLQISVGDLTSRSASEGLLRTFQTSIDQAAQRLPGIRGNIVGVLDVHCPYELYLKCTPLMNKAQTHLDMRYSSNDVKIPDVSALLNQLAQHTTDLNNLNQFNDTMHKIATVVEVKVNESLDAAWKDLAYSDKTRRALAESFEKYIGRFRETADLVRSRLNMKENSETNEIISRSMESRLYGGIALLCIPVLIILLVYLGLCFGTCGHRPYEEAGVCNRGVGANLLLAAVGFIFLFSSILMLTCTLLFVSGGPLQTDACRYLTGHMIDGPALMDQYIYESLQYIIQEVDRDTKLRQEIMAEQESQIVQIRRTETLDLLLNVSRARPLDAILNRCEREPFVDAISGGQLFFPVLNENIYSMLEKMMVQFEGVDLVKPLQRAVDLSLESLAKVDFIQNINLTRELELLNLAVTRIDDLEAYVNELRSLNMTNLTRHIDDLERHIVPLGQLRRAVHLVYEQLNQLPSQYHVVQNELTSFNTQITEVVNKTMTREWENLKPTLVHQLHLAVMATWREIPCKSLRIAVKRGVDAVCLTVLMPLNAIWAGLGITLLLFIPLIVCAVKLAGLYRKTEDYSPDYEEPDYISYHGFYMRPPSTGPVDSGKSKYKYSAPKGQQHRKKKKSSAQDGSGSRYHQVSVYPYDAYE